jgi:2-isopropylmalate synthase
LTYEIINPEEVGADSSKIVLTARSGRSALAFRFQKLGFQFDRNDVDTLYDEFLKMADSKKEVNDDDLQLIGKSHAAQTV